MPQRLGQLTILLPRLEVSLQAMVQRLTFHEAWTVKQTELIRVYRGDGLTRQQEPAESLQFFRRTPVQSLKQMLGNCSPSVQSTLFWV